MSGQDGVWGPHRLNYVAHTMALRPSAGGTGKGVDGSMLACSSFTPESANFVELLNFSHDDPQAVHSVGRLPHYIPPSRVRWVSSERLVTSGDYLRLWSVKGEQLRILKHDANPRNVCGPITSVDVSAGTSLASCDVYGICSFWDVEAGRATSAADLGQPLSDVTFGPGGLVAAAGDHGDLFLMDPRQPQNVDVLTLRERIRGPARMAWAPSSSGMLAVAWQGETGGLAVYDSVRKGPGQVLQSASAQSGAVADLQWCPFSSEFLCCASEGAGVEVWQIGGGAVRGALSFSWQPRAGEVSTSLALSAKGRQQRVVLATMPAHPTQGRAAGSLWVAELPEFSQAPDFSQAGGTVNDAPSRVITPSSMVE